MCLKWIKIQKWFTYVFHSRVTHWLSIRVNVLYDLVTLENTVTQHAKKANRIPHLTHLRIQNSINSCSFYAYAEIKNIELKRRKRKKNEITDDFYFKGILNQWMSPHLTHTTFKSWIVLCACLTPETTFACSTGQKCKRILFISIFIQFVKHLNIDTSILFILSDFFRFLFYILFIFFFISHSVYPIILTIQNQTQ